MLHNETIAFEWETAEFEFKEKRKDWYWVVGIVAVIIIIIAIVLQNYLFAFLILIGAFLMIVLSSREPLSLPIEISQHGISVYNEIYKYEDIFAFWISHNKKGQPILLLLSNRRISPIISLVIHKDIPLMELREYLGEFIEEQEIRESLTDKIIDKIGF